MSGPDMAGLLAYLNRTYPVKKQMEIAEVSSNINHNLMCSEVLNNHD